MYIIAENRAAPIPPAAAARHVVTKVIEVREGSAESTDPPLNPNQPSHSISTPAADKGIFEPIIASGFPSLSNLPFLAPKSI